MKSKNYSGRQIKEGISGQWNLLYKKSSENTWQVVRNRRGAAYKVRDERWVGGQWADREWYVQRFLFQGGRQFKRLLGEEVVMD